MPGQAEKDGLLGSYGTPGYTNRYLTVGSFLIGILLLIGMVGVVTVLLIEAHEWAEALWVTEHRRSFRPVPVADRDGEGVRLVSVDGEWVCALPGSGRFREEPPLFFGFTARNATRRP